MTTEIVNDGDVEMVARLGRDYLRTCKVADWKEIPDGRWAPKAWHVPTEVVEEKRNDPDARIVYDTDLETIAKLGKGYLRTCKVAVWEDRRPSAWVVPNDVLDLPEASYERRSVFKGDTAAARKLGEAFLGFSNIGGGEWSVPVFVLEKLNITPLTREQADGVRQRMSGAQHALNRSKYPEKAIAEEWLESAIDALDDEWTIWRKIEAVCETLAGKHPEGFFWLPRQELADRLDTEVENVSTAITLMKNRKTITGIATRGRLKIFKFLGHAVEVEKPSRPELRLVGA